MMGYNGYGNGYGNMMGGGVGVLGGLLMLLFFALVIAGLVLLVMVIVRNSGGHHHIAGGGPVAHPGEAGHYEAVSVAKKRLANGEITTEQYDEIMRKLGS